MKRISWITPEWFLDVDLPVIRYLKSNYDIRLIIVFPYDNVIDYQDYVKSFLGINKTNVEIINFQLMNRTRSLKNIIDYNRIISIAKSFSPDIYYISFMGMPYALPLYQFRLPKEKCVVACHNVSTPKGAKNEKIAELYKNWWLKVFKNIQVFSQGQYKVLMSGFEGKNVLLAPLMIKDYGAVKNSNRDDSVIKFLFFGNIVEYKRLDILIKAANILGDKCIGKFKVVIAGKSKNWDYYSAMIEHPELFETRIERIPNEEVADLFAMSHYFVMPYQDIAQSGAITVAFRYNVPTIVSDIPQFKEFVVENETSLSFKSQDAESLASVMQYTIEHHHEIYDSLCRNQKNFVDANFSDKSIVAKYKDYFERL